MADTVLPNLPQDVVDWAQVIGAFLALIAIVVSFYTLWRQRRDQIKDQRHQHDLEVLQEMKRLAAGDSNAYDEIISLSYTLHDSYAKPFAAISKVLSKMAYPWERFPATAQTSSEQQAWNKHHKHLEKEISDAIRWLVHGRPPGE